MHGYRTRLHILLEAAAWLLLLASFLIAVYGIKTLPETIATHYNMAGEADGYGSPATLLILPISMIIPLGIVSLVAHFVRPEYWNTPFQVTERNAAAVYRNLATMMFLIELELSVFTLYTQVKSFLQDGTGMLAASGLLMLAMFVTIIVLSVRAWKYNKRV